MLFSPGLYLPMGKRPTAAGGGSSVSFDAAGFYSSAGNASVTSQGFSGVLTVGSGSHRALLAFLFFAGNNAGAASSPALTWNGTSMTSIGGPFSNSTVGDIYIFGLVNPASGANTFNATWTGNAQGGIAAISVTGADQTGGATTFHNVTSAAATGVPTVTSTVPAGEIVAAGFISSNNFSTQGNTDIGHNNTNGLWAIAANYTTSTGSQSLLYNPSGNYAAASACIKAG